MMVHCVKAWTLRTYCDLGFGVKGDLTHRWADTTCKRCLAALHKQRGYDRAGIDTVLQVEIDATCRSVLARHWPDTERIADVRGVGIHDEGIRQRGQRERYTATQNESHPDVGWRANGQSPTQGVDLVYGGFPCQDLSVAGKRAGFGGERSGLWFEFERVLSEVRPRWAVIENVPGFLSSNGGADFAIILHALEELGYCVGWAVLDAQHFGVPQRRRRVFVVAGPGTASVRAVLCLCESCGGNPETGRETGEAVADTVGTSADRVTGRPGQLAIPDVAGTLGGGSSRRGWCSDTDHTTFVAQPVTARPYADGGGDENRNLIADTVMSTLTGGGDTEASHGKRSGEERYLVTDPIAQTLGARDYKGAGSFRDGSIQAHQMVAGRVRRLTPRECERLQGWPGQRETITVRVCPGSPKNCAPVGAPSPRSPRPVGSVENDRHHESVSSVEPASPSSGPTLEKRAVFHVVIDCEGSGLELHSPNESPIHVSNVESRSLFAHLGPSVDSARLGALIVSTLARITRAGRAESQQNSGSSSPLGGGNVTVNVSGQDIDEHACDAEQYISAATTRLRSTTSPVGQSSLPCDLILKTLCCSVVRAISGLIPEPIRTAGSFDLEVTLRSGYTQFSVDGSEISNSQRYRCIGNGVASPVAEWIGHRLVAVDGAQS